MSVPHAKRPARGLAGHKIATSLVKTWRHATIQRARLPKALRQEGVDEAQVMREIIRQEHRHVSALWERFTTERGQLSRYLMDPKKEAVAYLLGFHLPNVARSVMSLERAHRSLSFDAFFKAASDEITITDFGCGTGASTQAAVHFIHEHSRSGTGCAVHLIDANGAFLETARDLLGSMEPAPQVQTHKARLEEVMVDHARRLLKVPGTQLIALGYLWNEIAKNKVLQAQTLNLFAGLAKEGKPVMLLIAEPSNQMLARHMMELRDVLVGMGYLPIYPCRHATPCPMLERARDWCYSEFAWQRPEEIVALDKLVGIDRSQISSASYILVSPALKDLFPVYQEPSVVVGRPMARPTASGPKHHGRASGKFSYLLCHPNRLSTSTPSPEAPRVLLRGEKFVAREGKATATIVAKKDMVEPRTRKPKSRAAPATKQPGGKSGKRRGRGI